MSRGKRRVLTPVVAVPGSIATERQIQEVFNGSEYEAMTMAAQSLKRRILPEDVARLMLFLAAEDSSAITGSSYVIDGGWVSDK
jgi:NAD(P)-dependent dehydrogenase (short-subunit alcohol dehydrogenase family)